MNRSQRATQWKPVACPKGLQAFRTHGLYLGQLGLGGVSKPPKHPCGPWKKEPSESLILLTQTPNRELTRLRPRLGPSRAHWDVWIFIAQEPPLPLILLGTALR